MSYGVVYELVCMKTDMRYIGQTICGLDARWKGHCDAARNGIKWMLSVAIREHGVDSFQRRIICECDSKKELDTAERRFIKEFNTVWPNGYNMTNGGEGPCELTRQLISERTRLSMQDPSIRADISAKAKLRSYDVQVAAMIASNTGKHLSTETKAKLGRRVERVSADGTLLETFPTLTAAARSIEMSKSFMCAAINTSRLVKGTFWRYQVGHEVTQEKPVTER